MPARLSERRRWAILVGLAATLLAAANLCWVLANRHGYPMDIDEAGYTGIALVDSIGFKANGIGGWWEAVQLQGVFAPLVPALTSVLLVLRAGTLEGFAVLAGFLILLVLAVYGIGERLAGPRLGALAALVVATSAGAFEFSREYVFALPAAALLAGAVYALLRSDGLRRRGWSLALGAALGSMLLARTMTIAFVPGVLAAALVVLIARRSGDVGRRIANLGLAIASAVAVAALWYARNLPSVLDYLTNYGYGAQSSNYGPDHALVSWGRVQILLERTIAEDLQIPLAALLAVGLALVLALAVTRVARSSDRLGVLRQLAGGDALSVAIVLATGYSALASSQNGGLGFTFPLAVLLPTLAVLALKHLPRVAIPAIVLVGLIVAASAASNAGLWPAASEPRGASIPGLGKLPYLGSTPAAVGAIRQQVPGPAYRFDDRDRGWPLADRAVVGVLARWRAPDGELPDTAFASNSRVLNTNTVEVAALLTLREGFPVMQLTAAPSGSVAAYRRQLADPRLGRPTALIEMSSDAGDYAPRIVPAQVEAAARKLGFHRAWRTRLPDGRVLRIWHRDG